MSAELLTSRRPLRVTLTPLMPLVWPVYSAALATLIGLLTSHSAMTPSRPHENARRPSLDSASPHTWSFTAMRPHTANPSGAVTPMERSYDAVSTTDAFTATFSTYSMWPTSAAVSVGASCRRMAQRAMRMRSAMRRTPRKRRQVQLNSMTSAGATKERMVTTISMGSALKGDERGAHSSMAAASLLVSSAAAAAGSL